MLGLTINVGFVVGVGCGVGLTGSSSLDRLVVGLLVDSDFLLSVALETFCLFL
ncbi:hypothetical protein MmmBen181_0766 [Mycoplasma mycoides subsp. mycoides]|nr:hypothetical protein MmmBen181_0766 [Mycoplasma mycoides subsp. mycoides]